MATTTNYGWTTPDNTALVKDGASAIRTLGSSVDTTVKALSPGTTAGDVDYYTSSTAKARLAIGTTGQVLTVAGGVPSWATSASGGMTLLSTTSFASTTTISGISGAYTHLYMYIYGTTNATASNSFRIAPNGSTTITTNFATASASTVGTTGSTYLYPVGDFSQSRTDANNAYQITIYNYAGTAGYKPFSSSGNFLDVNGTNRRSGISGGGIETTSAITSLTFSNTGGALSTGTVLLYGVK